MFHEVADAAERPPAELETAYAEALRAAIEDRGGPAAAAAETSIDEATLQAAQAGGMADLTLAEGAAILALGDNPDVETIVADSLDALLFGMTTAVLDVEALASELDEDLDTREIQQKIEGRFPITLSEYARFHHAIQRQIP